MSHSTKDQEFAERLHGDFQNEKRDISPQDDTFA